MQAPDDWWLEHASGGHLVLVFVLAPIAALVLLMLLSYTIMSGS